MTGWAARWLALCCALGCSARFCASDAVAQLAVTVSVVERDFARSQRQWRGATIGAQFAVGDGVRTGTASSAELRLFPEGRLRVESDTVVRFQSTPPGQRQRRLEVEAGGVELESGAVELEVNTPAGVARVGRDSRVKVRSDDDQLRFDVVVGRLRLEREGNQAEARAGEGLTIDVGTLVIERVGTVADEELADSGEAAAQLAPDAAAGDPVDQIHGAGSTRFDEPPARAHLALAQGENATIHDPRPPTDVRVDLSACPGEAAAEVARAGGGFDYFRVRATGSAVVRLERGGYRYRVRCFADGVLSPQVVASGRLLVLRDPGTRKLPRTAPRAAVDVDGRRYTVRYQNLLPRLTVRWPNAPQMNRYVLEVKGASGTTRRYTSDSPTVEVDSSELGEGLHDLEFRGGAASTRGSLRIAFDNTARTAYLSQPPDGTLVAGSTATVTGAALQNSQVTVMGQGVAIQEEGRFATAVVVPSDVDAVAIRVQHSATGVHYYLRHTTASSAPGPKSE